MAQRRPTFANEFGGIHRRSNTSDTAEQDRWSALIAVPPAIAAVAICLPGVGRREVWADEFATAHASSLSFAQFGKLVRHLDVVHATYYLIMHFWIRLVGDSPFELRLPSVFAMAVCAACVGLVGRRLATPSVGLFAGMIFAVVPSVSRYGEEARSYGLVSMGAVASTLMLIRALEKDTRLRLVLYGLSIVFIGLLHFVALTILAAHAVLVFRTTLSTEARRWRLVETAGIAMLGVIPLLALASHQASSAAWIKADASAVKGFPERIFLSGPVATAIITLAVLGVAFLFMSRQREDCVVAVLLATWALVPPIFCYISSSALHLFLPRYVLFTVPAWSILAAIAACRAGELVWRHLWALTATVALILVAWVGLPAQAVVRESPVAGQPDFRSAITTVHDQLKSGDGIVYNDPVGGSVDLARQAVSYEMHGEPQPRDVFLLKTAAERGWYSASECKDQARCLGATPRLWLIYTGYSKDPFAGMAADRAGLLKAEFKISKTDKFTGVQLVLLTRVG